MFTFIAWTLLGVVALGLVGLGASVRVIKQFERGVVFRFGRVEPNPDVLDLP